MFAIGTKPPASVWWCTSDSALHSAVRVLGSAQSPSASGRINRLQRKGEDTDDLLLELEDKEKSYGRGKQQRPPGAYLATNQTFSTE